jgi:GNAT superfamily N-acetyltransferase
LLTPDRWKDFEKLFGENGACGGCWCMWWKLPQTDFNALKHDGNRKAQRALVRRGGVPGILAYADGEPAGWCAIEPRENYSRLERSRILKPVDDQPVWSVTCFFVRKDVRRRGVSLALLREAVDYAARNGARIVEGYPTEPRGGKAQPAAFVYTGLAAAFRQAGFREVARRSPTRPIFRYEIRP